MDDIDNQSSPCAQGDEAMAVPEGLFSEGALPLENASVSVMPAAVAPVGEAAGLHVSTFVPPMPAVGPLPAPATAPRQAIPFATEPSLASSPQISPPFATVVQAIPSGGGAWTLVPLCLGLIAIAVCVIFPQIDANRRLDYERQKLVADLDQINRQTSLDDEFLRKIEIDPQLAQRLAQRQMKFIRQGESVLPYKARAATSGAAGPLSPAQESPFSLVRVPPPPVQAPYSVAGGWIGEALLDSHVRLYCLAGGLFLVAVGLVLGSNDDHAPRPCP